MTWISIAAGALQRAGHNRRGNVKKLSCECYELSKREFGRLPGKGAARTQACSELAELVAGPCGADGGNHPFQLLEAVLQRGRRLPGYVERS